MWFVVAVVVVVSRVKQTVSFISMSVDELCDQVTSFEHGRVRMDGWTDGSLCQMYGWAGLIRLHEVAVFTNFHLKME